MEETTHASTMEPTPAGRGLHGPGSAGGGGSAPAGSPARMLATRPASRVADSMPTTPYELSVIAGKTHVTKLAYLALIAIFCALGGRDAGRALGGSAALMLI